MRYRTILLAASGLATMGVLLLVLVPSAFAVGPNEYTATISPTSVVAGSAHTYTLTFTNSGTSGLLSAANTTIPSGFTGASVGVPTTSSGNTWTASIVSGVVQLRAANNGQRLSPGASVSVGVTATAPTVTSPQGGPGSTWATAANGAIGFNGTALTNAGTDPVVLVTPAALDHFNFAAIGPQIAGNAIPITVTAIDVFGNFKYDYSGSGTLSGLFPAPNGTPPVYNNPLTITNGIGTGSVTAYDANNPNVMSDVSTLSVSSGTKSGTTTFKVSAADPFSLTFTQQPNDAQPNPPTCSNPFVCVIATKVQDLDQFGNPEVGVNVTLVVDPAHNPGSDSLSGSECTGGSCVQAADDNGIATFSDLTMHVIATDYALKASSGPTVGLSAPATAVSSLFNIAQTVKKCNGNCTASASDQFDTITATASGLSGNLSIAIETAGLPASCGITTQVGNLVTVNPTNPTASPTLEVTGTLLHKNNASGIGNSIICKNSGPGTPFHQVQKCSQSAPPCLKKLSGNGQGDIFFDLIVKATQNADGSWTFDPKMGGGS
jgi:hypothetical protein